MEPMALQLYTPSNTEENLVLFIQQTITALVFLSLAILFATECNKN
jgi:hypothetical protein